MVGLAVPVDFAHTSLAQAHRALENGLFAMDGDPRAPEGSTTT